MWSVETAWKFSIDTGINTEHILWAVNKVPKEWMKVNNFVYQVNEPRNSSMIATVSLHMPLVLKLVLWLRRKFRFNIMTACIRDHFSWYRYILCGHRRKNNILLLSGSPLLRAPSCFIINWPLILYGVNGINQIWHNFGPTCISGGLSSLGLAPISVP